MATVRNAITDGTSFENLTPEAIRMWRAIVEAAGRVGIDRVDIVAGAGGGHSSHAHGTEIDLIGYNADGSTWTARQRVQIAAAAAEAGGNRFGFYSRSDRPVSVLHVGLGYDGAPANVAWGPGGATSGVGVNAFYPEEREFVTLLRSGQLFPRLRELWQEWGQQPQNPPIPPMPIPNVAPQTAATVPTVANVVTSGAVLRAGSSGEGVRELQQFLNGAGITDADGRPLAEDGDFGPRTEEAVRAYQSERGLSVDGIVGPQTATAVQRDLAGDDAPAIDAAPQVGPVPPPDISAVVSTVNSGVMLQRGSRGEDVRALQRFLNFAGYTDSRGSALVEDGILGSKTRQAVRAFQQANGIGVDGVVGSETAGAMIAAVTPPRFTTGSAPAVGVDVSPLTPLATDEDMRTYGGDAVERYADQPRFGRPGSTGPGPTRAGVAQIAAMARSSAARHLWGAYERAQMWNAPAYEQNPGHPDNAGPPMGAVANLWATPAYAQNPGTRPVGSVSGAGTLPQPSFYRPSAIGGSELDRPGRGALPAFIQALRPDDRRGFSAGPGTASRTGTLAIGRPEFPYTPDLRIGPLPNFAAPTPTTPPPRRPGSIAMSVSVRNMAGLPADENDEAWLRGFVSMATGMEKRDVDRIPVGKLWQAVAAMQPMATPSMQPVKRPKMTALARVRTASI